MTLHPTASPPTTSPLLALPPELRNRIYKLALVQQYSIDLLPLRTSATDHPISCAAQQPPLTLTSRQIRQESLALFYAANTFEVYAFGIGPVFFMDLRHILRWCVKIGSANRRAMGRIVVCTRGCGDVIRGTLGCMGELPETLGCRWRWEGVVEVEGKANGKMEGRCVANAKYGEDLQHYAFGVDA
ncbi:hypothetical protein LTR65_005661 [Meristemomyces frigidus]